jgi:hypothetical protein
LHASFGVISRRLSSARHDMTDFTASYLMELPQLRSYPRDGRVRSPSIDAKLPDRRSTESNPDEHASESATK